jgi:hypothetical protein
MLTCQRPPRRKREPIKTFPDGKQVCDVTTAEGLRQYKARKVEMWMRQERRCPLCDLWINSNAIEFDHQIPRGAGNQDDRIEVDGMWQNAAVHHRCNTRKGSTRYHWLNNKYVPVMKMTEVA